MYGLPRFEVNSIKQAIPGIESIDGTPLYGGQKVVYCATIGGKRYALKIIPMIVEALDVECPRTSAMPDDISPRTLREVRILEYCDVPQLPKLGPLKLTNCNIEGQNVAYYTEEWVEGRNLRDIIRSQRLDVDDAVNLALDLSTAIAELWKHNIIHRDIKPINIIKKTQAPGYSLLDPGIAYDLNDVSLTQVGLVAGTFPYYSPEQMDVSRKRDMDYRSDFFNVGTVLYEATTGIHPFLVKNNGIANRHATHQNITSVSPKLPSAIQSGIPTELDDVIMKLLAKKPHLRQKSFDVLNRDLERVKDALRRDS